MSNAWKGFIIIVLAVAVSAIVINKQNAAQRPVVPSTRPTSTSDTSSHAVATPPAPSAPADTARTRKMKNKPALVSGTATKVSPRTTPGIKPTPVQASKAGNNAVATSLPQLVELGSTTCIPCQMMQPILEELRKEYEGQLEVPFWDIYEHPDKAKAYKIRVIPTQVFIGADGKEFFRHEGFFAKEDILAKFKEHGIILRPVK